MLEPPAAMIQLFRRHDAVVAESIISDGTDVMWCDITRGMIHRSSPYGPTDGLGDVMLQLATPVCSFHCAESGFIVSLADAVILVDHIGATVRELTHIVHAGAHMRLNEGKVDPAGRWVTGSMELDTGAPIGAFYSITSTGECRVIATGIGTANGLEWSADGTRIYYTDTASKTIYTGDYSNDGDITNVEVFHTGPPHDGLVMDADGNFWGGIFGQGYVIHLDARGRELFSVPLPVPNITSVAFHGTTLYIASARENLSASQLAEYPLSGSLFSLETTTSARPPRTFPA